MPATGGPAQRISFGEGSYSTPVWSPRGDYIAFTKQGGGQFAIGIMKTDGSGERILTSGYHNEGPTFAPNGRVVMFFREPGGNSGPSLYHRRHFRAQRTARADARFRFRSGLVAAVVVEHDPEKWAPVFPRDKREAFARRSCSNRKIERDDDSKKRHHASVVFRRLGKPRAPRSVGFDARSRSNPLK